MQKKITIWTYAKRALLILIAAVVVMLWLGIDIEI